MSIPLEQGLRQSRPSPDHRFLDSMSIPLEQGLRQELVRLEDSADEFYEHSIRTRIKTVSGICELVVRIYSMSIPLEQGLRRNYPFDAEVFYLLFYEHSIRTRIKTRFNQRLRFPESYSMSIPLEQGLRQQ